MTDILAMILAGGVGSRLNILSYWRAKPAVPFGGIYRIIDFTLSNVANSGIENVAVLTQYRPLSLMRHIGTGESWDLSGRTRGVKILSPFQGKNDSDWFQGTADAIRQNIDYIENFTSKYVLILSGDHIYQMDYKKLVHYHENKNANITVAMYVVQDREEAKGFGIGITNDKMEIIDWEEKPEKPRSNLASMGVYVFNKDFLLHSLKEVPGVDFGKDIIPYALAQKEVGLFAYPFDHYWRDVGTLRAYWQANMDLLDENSGVNLDCWHTMTSHDEAYQVADRPPTFIAAQAEVTDSIISPGCEIYGKVVRSILSPGVFVGKNAHIANSIIMHDSCIGANSQLNEVIADKSVTIEANCTIGVGDCTRINQKFPKHVNTGLVIIGKLATVPAGTTVGCNCIIFPNINASFYPDRYVKDGDTIMAPDSIEIGGLLFT